jgi:hypothetical protein
MMTSTSRDTMSMRCATHQVAAAAAVVGLCLLVA